MDINDKKRAVYRQGVIVLVVLGVLTAVEYLVAVNLHAALVILFILALFKAGPIVQYFMHINSLWSEEEGH
ncbi:MAG: cytochrome C oxidase subunit IV family protein [Anaerolineae bacterium]